MLSLPKTFLMPRARRPWLNRWFARASIAKAASVSNQSNKLQAAVSELAQVNHSTEADFLAIGAKLSSFVAAARGISTAAKAIEESFSGGRGRDLSLALSAVTQGSAERERDAAAARDLGGMRQAVAEIQQNLSTFEQVGPSFQVMAALARIETAHLGAAGLDLGNLADEFRVAGEGIRSRVQHILNGTTMLERRIEAALKDVASFDERSRHALDSLLVTATQGLNEFQAQQEKSAQGALRLASESAAIAKSISDLVTALQTHDITRQQVEHVVDSLRQLGDANDPIDKTLALVHLQTAQLENASRAFASAVSRMDRDLEEIASRIGRMVAESANLLGSPATSEGSFLAQMEDCFRAIRSASADRAHLESDTTKAFSGLEETLHNLTTSAAEIHRVELQLRWLAINAAINAAHIGVPGEPLNAIAAAMHGLLADCEKSSSAADRSIGSISQIFHNATRNSKGSEAADGELLILRFRSQLDELHGVEQESEVRTRELTSSAARLSTEVDELRSGFSAGRIFEAAAVNCCAILRDIQKQAGVDPSAIDQSHLDALKQQYTMQSEREIHDEIFASKTPAATVMDAPEPSAAKEFDDNIELF